MALQSTSFWSTSVYYLLHSSVALFQSMLFKTLHHILRPSHPWSSSTSSFNRLAFCCLLLLHTFTLFHSMYMPQSPYFLRLQKSHTVCIINECNHFHVCSNLPCATPFMKWPKYFFLWSSIHISLPHIYYRHYDSITDSEF